jgi:hypothetical protein
MEAVDQALGKILFTDIDCTASFGEQRVDPVAYSGPRHVHKRDDGSCYVESWEELLDDYPIDRTKVASAFDTIVRTDFSASDDDERLVLQRVFEWLVQRVTYVTWSDVISALTEAVKMFALCFAGKGNRHIVLYTPGGDSKSNYYLTAVAWFHCGLREVIKEIIGTSHTVTLHHLSVELDSPICLFVDDASYSGNQLIPYLSELIRTHDTAQVAVIVGFTTKRARNRAKALGERVIVICTETMDSTVDIAAQYKQSLQELDSLLEKKNDIERHLSDTCQPAEELLLVNTRLRELRHHFGTLDTRMLRRSFDRVCESCWVSTHKESTTLHYFQHKRPDHLSSHPFFIGSLIRHCSSRDQDTCPLPFYKYHLRDGKWIKRT